MAALWHALGALGGQGHQKRGQWAPQGSQNVSKMEPKMRQNRSKKRTNKNDAEMIPKRRQNRSKRESTWRQKVAKICPEPKNTKVLNLTTLIGSQNRHKQACKTCLDSRSHFWKHFGAFWHHFGSKKSSKSVQKRCQKRDRKSDVPRG